MLLPQKHFHNTQPSFPLSPTLLSSSQIKKGKFIFSFLLLLFILSFIMYHLRFCWCCYVCAFFLPLTHRESVQQWRPILQRFSFSQLPGLNRECANDWKEEIFKASKKKFCDDNRRSTLSFPSSSAFKNLPHAKFSRDLSLVKSLYL